ncbi:ion-transporting P-type ATPase [Blattamonas nauphoetae]|uniref:Ion-transporting P-type ATPase n=1 Tax=Blattamonas nauphoetae TaxID=2049346 RepID=A0ABQ9WWG8_9EUKA|nr:ion-transporting P-type ATPase [Blattamonas nauphoetae]
MEMNLHSPVRDNCLPFKILEDTEAEERQRTDGLNELSKEKRVGVLGVILGVMKEPMFVLLLCCVLLLLFIVGVISLTIMQEYRTEHALSSLRSLTTPTTRIICPASSQRASSLLPLPPNINSSLQSSPTLSPLLSRPLRMAEVPSKVIVSGDIAVVRCGDVVSADGVLLVSLCVSVDESILTGESQSVPKTRADVQQGSEWNNRLRTWILPSSSPSATSSNPSHSSNNDEKPEEGKEGLPEPGDAASASCVYAGTTVTRGEGLMIVTHTGTRSHLGEMSKSEGKKKRELTPLERTMRLLVVGMFIVGVLLSASVFIVLVVTRSGFDADTKWTKIVLAAALAALSLLMTLLPEEFPVVHSVFLSLGAWRLSRKPVNILTRDRKMLEWLGCVSVLCLDKTGTLTHNEMQLNTLYAARERSGLDNKSDTRKETREIESINNDGDSEIDGMCEQAENTLARSPLDDIDGSKKHHSKLCLSQEGDESDSEQFGRMCAFGEEKTRGMKGDVNDLLSSAVRACPPNPFDPLDRAIHSAFTRLSDTPTQFEQPSTTSSLTDESSLLSMSDGEWREILAKQFSPVESMLIGQIWVCERTVSSSSESLQQHPAGEMDRKVVVAVKGAMESVCCVCEMSREEKDAALKAVREMGKDGQRVIGIAEREFPLTFGHSFSLSNSELVLPLPSHTPLVDLASHICELNFAIAGHSDSTSPAPVVIPLLTFRGALAFSDPVRPNVGETLDSLRERGVRQILLTGDAVDTAKHVAAQCHIPSQSCRTGAELDKLSDDALSSLLSPSSAQKCSLFARVQPRHKERVVRVLREQGEVVLMTGDGVNDVPALRSAHLGVSFASERATAVARSTAGLLLMDGVESIGKAVSVGCRMRTNMRHAVVFIISVHLPFAILLLVPPLCGWPRFIRPSHLVLNELVIDPACSIVFEMEGHFGKRKHERLDRARVTTKKTLLTRWDWTRAVVLGVQLWTSSSSALSPSSVSSQRTSRLFSPTEAALPPSCPSSPPRRPSIQRASCCVWCLQRFCCVVCIALHFGFSVTQLASLASVSYRRLGLGVRASLWMS